MVKLLKSILVKNKWAYFRKMNEKEPEKEAF